MRPLRLGALLGLVMFALGGVPYLAASFSCPGWTFSGVLSDWPDTKQHLSLIAQSQHALVVPNIFTTDASRPFLVSLETIVGGALMRLLDGNLIAVFHAVRLVGCMLFSVGTVIGAYHFASPHRRALAITLAHCPLILGIWPRALGWPAWLVQSSLIDGNSVSYAFEQPQLAVAAGLVVLAMVSLDRFWKERARVVPWRAMIAVVAIWLDHPFEWWAVGFVYVLLVAQLWRRGVLSRASLVRCALVGVTMASPALLYLAADRYSGGGYTLLSKTFGNGWPLPTDLLLTIGASFVLALVVITNLVCTSDSTSSELEQRPILATWFVGTIVAVYLPFAPWRWHQINGLQVAAALLAVRARLFDSLVATTRRRAALCGACMAVSLGLQAPYLAGLAKDATHCAAPYFYSAGDLKALDWLRDHATDEDHVLCRGRFGLDVSMHSTARPYFAFPKKTPGWREKQTAVNRFLSAQMENVEANHLLRQAAITYVLCELPGDAICHDERLLPLGTLPVFSSRGTRLYRVGRSEKPAHQ